MKPRIASIPFVFGFCLSCLFFLNVSFVKAEVQCQINQEQIAQILNKIDNQTSVKKIPDCIKANRYFVAELILLNNDYFNYASNEIKDDEEFVSEFVAQNPKILNYISKRLKSDPFFFFKVISIYPNALEYASPKLIDNKAYMMKMVAKNPKNFSYATERLQDDFDLTMLAVSKNGKMLGYASERLRDNPLIAKKAVTTDVRAVEFVSDRLKKDRLIKSLVQSKKYDFLQDFDNFLAENYRGIKSGGPESEGYHIVNLAKFFPQKQLINRPYIVKWEEVRPNAANNSLARNNYFQSDNYKLVNDNRDDYGWKLDFAKYPALIKEIENIFKINRLDQNTIDAIKTVSLWQVSKKPLIMAFDLYLLRDVRSKYLKGNFSNITSISAIARKKLGKNDQWDISIVDALFDADIKMDINYKNGHKRYKIWDLYQNSKKDRDLKILFKIEDNNAEYFDLFAQQPSGGYASIFQGGGYYH